MSETTATIEIQSDEAGSNGIKLTFHRDGLVEIQASSKGFLQITAEEWQKMMSDRLRFMHED